MNAPENLPPVNKPKRPQGKSIWPRIPAGFVRAVLAGHSALGLAFAALIYLVCFSGTVAVFIQEFERWERPEPAPLARVAPDAIQAALEAAAADLSAPVEHARFSLPRPGFPRFELHADTEDHAEERAWFLDATGAVAGPAETPWSNFLARLHIYLHLPQAWGIFVVGLTGVALLSSLISGMFAHPRIFRDAFSLRIGGSRRLQEADLHTRIGVWGLPFHIMISLTGALLGLLTVIAAVLAMVLFKGDVNKAYDYFLPPHPPEDTTPAPLPDIAAALAIVQEAAPETTPRYIFLEHPQERGQAILITASRPHRLSRGDNFYFDGAGDLVRTDRLDEATLGEQIFGVLAPLHFGWFGGGLIKIAYAILGLGVTIVTASGVSVWLARRRDKGRPAPGWERIWIACIWSQPVAFAASALAALVVPPAVADGPAFLTWLIATVAVLLTAKLWPPADLSRKLRTSGGILLLIVPGAHLICHAGQIQDPMAWTVNGTLGLLGLGMIASVAGRRLLRNSQTAG